MPHYYKKVLNNSSKWPADIAANTFLYNFNDNFPRLIFPLIVHRTISGIEEMRSDRVLAANTS